MQIEWCPFCQKYVIAILEKLVKDKTTFRLYHCPLCHRTLLATSTLVIKDPSCK